LTCFLAGPDPDKVIDAHLPFNEKLRIVDT
jgi:hypothetical protein